MQNTKNIEIETTNGYQVIITEIHWNKETIKSYKLKTNDYNSLPSQFNMDIPENVLNQAKKNQNEFNNIIETFVYNFLTKKFGHEVYNCQIWLPIETK